MSRTDTASRITIPLSEGARHQAYGRAERVVRSDPARAVAFWGRPIGPAAWQWTLAFGWRPDLAKPFDIVPVRLAVEVTRRVDLYAKVVGRPARGRWSLRIRSDFALIEQRIAYRWIGRHLVNRLVKGRVNPWTLAAEEQRLEALAWRTESPVQAQVALRGVEAIRGVAAEHGFPDSHGRTDRRGFFG